MNINGQIDWDKAYEYVKSIVNNLESDAKVELSDLAEVEPHCWCDNFPPRITMKMEYRDKNLARDKNWYLTAETQSAIAKTYPEISKKLTKLAEKYRLNVHGGQVFTGFDRRNGFVRDFQREIGTYTFKPYYTEFKK